MTFKHFCLTLFLIAFSTVINAQGDAAKRIPPIINFLLDAQPGSVSGTLSLPEGITAVGTGATFQIQSFLLQVGTIDGVPQSSSDTVTIANGQNSTGFSFNYLNVDSSIGPYLSFECIDGCETLGITTRGFWSEIEGVVGSAIFSSATRYADDRDHEVDVLLQEADTFSGTLSLPDGFSLTEDSIFIVSVQDTGFFQFDSYSTILEFESDDTSKDFVIGVSQDETSSWNLTVRCLGPCPAGLVDDTQLATEFVGDPLSENPDIARIFPVGSDYSNLSLTLLERMEP